ncbi:hypothetical protein [Methanobrevibacter sp.]
MKLNIIAVLLALSTSVLLTLKLKSEPVTSKLSSFSTVLSTSSSL